MSEKPLRECPFCGKDAEMQCEGEPGYENWWAECMWDHACGSSRPSEAEALAAWNTRPPLPAPAGRPEFAKRWYCCYNGPQGAHMEAVHSGRVTEEGHYYEAADYEALQAYAETLEAELLDVNRLCETVNDKLREQP